VLSLGRKSKKIVKATRDAIKTKTEKGKASSREMGFVFDMCSRGM